MHLNTGVNSRDTDNIRYKTQNKNKQNKNTTHKANYEQHGPHQKIGGEIVNGTQFLLLIRHPPCYSYIQSSPEKMNTGGKSVPWWPEAAKLNLISTRKGNCKLQIVKVYTCNICFLKVYTCAICFSSCLLNTL